MTNEIARPAVTAPFSPGPWRLFGPQVGEHGIQSITILSGKGRARFGIAAIRVLNPSDGPTATANARLIAAAPCMYDALQTLEAALIRDMGAGYAGVALAQAVLAEARGEQ